VSLASTAGVESERIFGGRQGSEILPRRPVLPHAIGVDFDQTVEHRDSDRVLNGGVGVVLQRIGTPAHFWIPGPFWRTGPRPGGTVVEHNLQPKEPLRWLRDTPCYRVDLLLLLAAVAVIPIAVRVGVILDASVRVTAKLIVAAILVVAAAVVTDTRGIPVVLATMRHHVHEWQPDVLSTSKVKHSLPVGRRRAEAEAEGQVHFVQVGDPPD